MKNNAHGGANELLECEEPSGIPDRERTERSGFYTSRLRKSRHGEAHPRGLIALAAMRHGRKVWRVGLGEEPVVRHDPQQRLVRPLPERDDSAERHVPTACQRDLGQLDAASVAMQHADHPRTCRLPNHVARVVLCLARVDDDGAAGARRERQLRAERRTLFFSRRMVVVVVQSALAYSDGAGLEVAEQHGDVACGIEISGVMRVNSGGVVAEAGVVTSDLGRALGGRKGLTDADDSNSTSLSCPCYDTWPIRVECRIGEMSVTVDEGRHENANRRARRRFSAT